MSRFEIQSTALPGVHVLERKPIGDRRGRLERMFCARDLGDVLGARGIAQINLTATAKQGTVRGMHFQRAPHAEMKFVSCLRGRIFDVALDLRRGSPTFLRWHAEELSPDNHRTLVIPEGCAHGFQALAADCEVLYFHTAAYEPSSESGVSPQDSRVAIAWPEDIAELSPRDASHPQLNADFEGL
jgi:dTDP-4-dehydrorhamnose 3,5-epimerase